jgi:hypothetical protein
MDKVYKPVTTQHYFYCCLSAPDFPEQAKENTDAFCYWKRYKHVSRLSRGNMCARIIVYFYDKPTDFSTRCGTLNPSRNWVRLDKKHPHRVSLWLA